MIQALGLTSNPRKELPPAVDDVSFEAHSGRVTALLGAPGAGKSTVLKLALELQQGRGVAYFRGRPLHRIAHPTREVGVLLGDVPGHPARTVRGHLRMLCAAAGLPARRADEVLEVVGLVSLGDARLNTLSRGMDRRLGLACALLSDPHTLVLDDPTDGLAVREGRWLHGIMRAHADQGGTVLFTTGDPKEAARTADRVLTLERGRLVADQEVADFSRTRLRPRVAVRTPHAARLEVLLTKEARTARRSVEIVREGGNRLSVYGSTCAEIGETVFRHGILVHQLADEIGDMGPTPPSVPVPVPSTPPSLADEGPAVAETARGPLQETRGSIDECLAPTDDPHALSSDPYERTGDPHAPTSDPHELSSDPHELTGDPHAHEAAEDPQATADETWTLADGSSEVNPAPLIDLEPPADSAPRTDAESRDHFRPHPDPTTDDHLGTRPGRVPSDPPGTVALPPPITVRPAPSPLRPLRYELRRAGGVGTAYFTAAAVLVTSALMSVLLARIGHTPQPRLLASWPRELPLPPAAIGAGLLGAIAFGDEFRHPALAAARGTVPRRLGLLLAKLLVAAVTALLLAVLTVGCDLEVLYLVYGPELVSVPADWFPLGASWLGLVVGCAWAGVLAAGVFRSTSAGLAAVVAVPLVVVPLVQQALEGTTVRSAVGFPVRLRELVLVQWPFGGGRYLEAVARTVSQPVGGALLLSLTALLGAYVLTNLRSRVR
ncbi:ABC transporter ATP-binding protein [Streptomyces stelliscabiei]|uniref:ABC-type multidrug transport system ATPase subunit n=1 Tax=Streptomyces stelliscabiei TaxID=146820 RepID=A0A8I0PFL8_9ACTN|nr:ABC transporter ATP-binding protein [Streptomyces stelliscabiei]KND40771.1 ABC transporter [Streptomyces stelliscabiei]MBE1600708.1 ABC-type multidrug transport system ATPase subunit [Streptomyces stelliscabiei]MDX2521761.1 ATP-binding cassette domain-containing protein [Streptomyces stelliscabiei]MDX2554139.1 ATP-binding cassette domain-containing protein [Streptomyces stelliscabiei]MDX2609817.1 ATP-binding cassette domain-containing protein [Streptomyces stelliscabiei]